MPAMRNRRKEPAVRLFIELPRDRSPVAGQPGKETFSHPRPDRASLPPGDAPGGNGRGPGIKRRLCNPPEPEGQSLDGQGPDPHLRGGLPRPVTPGPEERTDVDKAPQDA